MRALLLVLLLIGGMARAECPAGDFPPFYAQTKHFDAGLARSADVKPVDGISGAILPHHLEMPELLGAAIRMTARPGVKRAIVLFPDHFFRSDAPFATTARGFETVLGPVPTDPAAEGLIDGALVQDSCLFDKEHGLRAVLPFMARLMPGVSVIPVAVSINSRREHWDALAERLAPLLGPETVVLQATDYSHYLPLHEARQRDQQVLNLLAAMDLDGVAGLVQPDHVDSTGAMYITMKLLGARGARPVVVANANMQELYKPFIAETTSYVVAAYAPEGAEVPPFVGQRFMIGGDLFLGRVLPGLLSDELISDRVAKAALAATHGLPLVLNLEGVLLPQMPAGLDHMVLGMPADLLRDWARLLNVVAVSLANNHARDIGESGLAETRAALARFGIAAFGQGEALPLMGATLVGLTDLEGRAVPPVDRLTPELLDRVIHTDATSPVIAFLHWGREFVTQPAARETDLAEGLRQRGVAVVIGAHPHAASTDLRALGGGDTVVLHSLGNFLFDQLPPHSSGALAEVRVFPQGTVFVRQLPLPHLFELTQAGN
ncbi:AmmeMemoRadiSam system protein B [Thalassobius vesicularis]|uniref:AmmeMemoRadiSam system protein B n=1 Tax=Thalassobius vesicularis TaxID=1294297 RepID=A0A4V3UZB7_9RHOB|nr:AmmeMemoRadiSam system protein B [Thalassobius vesicularis]THD76265.1 AmmeMemoRadiSam system protein B [Thalassobius vesicularis]